MAEKIDLDALLKLPKCDKFSRLIVGKMLKALGRAFHDACFVCTACGKSLGEGCQVDEKKPDQGDLPQHKPHCPECYARLFTGLCKSCGKAITDQSYVNACKGSWREKCFVCQKCKEPLGKEGKHWPVNDKPYCQKHYWEARLINQGKQPQVQAQPPPPPSGKNPQAPTKA